MNSYEVTIVVGFAPPKQQALFWDEVFGELAQNRHSEIIMLEDFNAVFHSTGDHSKDSLTPGFPLHFYHYIESFHLVDIWQRTYLCNQDYTFFSARHLTHARIDLILALEGFDSHMRNVHMGPRVLSVHVPVSLDWQMGGKSTKNPRLAYE